MQEVWTAQPPRCCDLRLIWQTASELPKGYIIRPQLEDRVEDLTNDLPFLTLERRIYTRFAPLRLTPMLGNTDRLELRDYLRVQRGLPSLQVSNEAWYKRLVSKKSALHSILPCTKGPMNDTGSDSIPSMRMEFHISELHRHILCALGNNLAGLGNISGEQLYHLLRIVSDKHIIVKLLSEGGHLRLPIARQLLRAGIEVGNAPMVDTILSMRVLQININELTCEVNGDSYTALERASILRNKALIDVMLRHGADVHKTFDRQFSWRLDRCSGALECALLGDTPNDRLDSQIFNTLLEKIDRVKFSTLEILMGDHEYDPQRDTVQYEFLSNVLKKFAHTNHDDWQIASGAGCIWETILKRINQEAMALEILDIVERLGAAKTTRMLNIAASKGHHTVVLRLLQENIGLNHESLCSAIRGKNEELIRLFLKKRATVNDYTADWEVEYDEDPYSEAVRTDDKRIIDILVEHHALERLDQWIPWLCAWKAAVTVCNKAILAMLHSKRQNIPAHHLGCALSSASKLGDYQMVIELLKCGAELDAVSEERGYRTRPPLVEALKAEQYEIADLFLNSGANPNAGNDHEHESPIVLAVRNGNHAMVERLLVAGALVGSRVGSSAFQTAVERKDFKMMEKLWDAGASSDGALKVAVEHDSVDACDWLISHGADPRDSLALCRAYQQKKDSSFRALLNAVKLKYPRGAGGGFASEVLCNALKSRDRPAVALLLQHGADPSSFVSKSWKSLQQVTPFFVAVTLDEGHDTSWAELFLDYGHKSNVFECTPQTVVARLADLHLKHGSSSIVSQSCRQPGAMITALLAAVGTKNMTVVRLLSRREDADIDFPASGRIRRTPLQRAAEIGSLDLVEFFYGLGADVNARPARVGGATALQLAAQGGFTAIVVYLLSKGTAVDAPGAVIDGMTALECAAAHGRVDVLYCLLRANAGQGGHDYAQFKRASAYAEKAAHFSIVDMLREHLQSVGQYSLFLGYKEQSTPAEDVSEPGPRRRRRYR